MRLLFLWGSVIALAVVCIAYSQQSTDEPVPLPELNGSSGKGLEMQCSLVQTRFVVGEPINVWCTIKNTTDGIKPVGWHTSAGNHYCFVQEDRAAWEGGLLPLAIPQLTRPILIKSTDSRPGYVLFIPPHESIQILLTHKQDRAVKFKGRVVYDPLSSRDAWGASSKEDGPPWKNDLISSNEFEYEVVEASDD